MYVPDHIRKGFKMPTKGFSGVPADIRLESLPDPGNRFTLGVVIGSGVSATVYEALDTQAGEEPVAFAVKSHTHLLRNYLL